MSKKISIIGGGIAGLTTAISLQSIGYEPEIFEATPEIKPVGAGLVLAANAIKAYKNLGLLEDISREGKLVPYFSILDNKGRVLSKTQTNKFEDSEIVQNYAIHRADLHKILLSKINSENLFLNKRSKNLDVNNRELIIEFQDGTIHKTDKLVVAEGIHSIIRKKLISGSKLRYAGYTCWRAVIDSSGLNINEVSESWGKGRRFGIVPLSRNRIYWFACLNGPENNPEFKNFGVEEITLEFKDFHENVLKILERTKKEEVHWADIIDLEPIENFAFGNVLLIGDAAHATTPNMGQGACQAIEDAVVIADELKKVEDFQLAFKVFEKRRIKRTHNIVKKSWQLGKIGQLENNFLIGIRNFIFKNVPSSFNDKRIKELYEVDF